MDRLKLEYGKYKIMQLIYDPYKIVDFIPDLTTEEKLELINYVIKERSNDRLTDYQTVRAVKAILFIKTCKEGINNEND